MTESNKKPTRYMDFIGDRRASSTDPLISRPVSKRPVEKAPVKKVEKPAPKKPVAEKVAVKKSVEKPLIPRKPATSRDLYPTKTTDKPVDETAKKAAAALSGTKKSPDAPDGNSYSLSGKSPFLPSYSVDKRPLSSSVPEKKKSENFEKLSFLGVSDSSEKPRKNVYEKKSEEKKEKKEKKPVKIIDDGEKKSGLPLFVVIILTILLGAAVGAGVYFILPK